MTPLEQLDFNLRLTEEINSILERNGVKQRITPNDVTVTEKSVVDLFKSPAILSDAITQHLWPSVESATVYHYTSTESAESILNSGIFRLHSILKRSDEGEVSKFCDTHKLKGYLESDKNGEPVYKSLLMPSMFYASFTRTNIKPDREEVMWRRFASCGGVRLKLSIAASNPNLREVMYEAIAGTPIPLLYDLSNVIQNNYHKSFVLKGISRLCAFYLAGQDYGVEQELRMLYKVQPGYGPQPLGAGRGQYVELPIGVMSDCGYRLEVLEVHASARPNMPSKYQFSPRVS